MTTTKAPRINYVFVDHENVSLDEIDRLNDETVRLIVFVGKGQKKIDVQAAMALQRLGTRAEYVQMSGTGPNALDFHVAFYLGRLAQIDQRGYFHIVARDKGYDPLIEHLKAQKIFCARSDSFATIPFVKAKVARSATERAAAYRDHVNKPKTTRPAKRKTLISSINTFFGGDLSAEETEAVIEALQKDQLLSFVGEKTQWLAAPSQSAT